MTAIASGYVHSGKPTRGSSILAYIGLGSLALVLSLLCGLAAGLGNLLLSILLLGLAVGLGLLAKPVWMFWMLGAIVLVLHGVVQFFVGFGQLQWIASALGFGLLLASAAAMALKPSNQKRGLNPIDVVLMCFLVLLMIGTVLAKSSPVQIFVGLRTYLPFLGAYLVFRSGLLDQRTQRAMLVALFVVALMQWPVELYQKIFVVSERQALKYFGSAWDSIVGTFGGAKFGGGASGSLAIFLVVIGLVALAWAREDLIRGSRLFLLLGSVLLALGLSETKAVFVLLPVGLLLLFWKEFIRHPGKAILGSVVTGISLAILLFVYYKFYWEAEQTRGTILEALKIRFAYSFDPTFMPAPDWPGRFTGLAIWLKHHGLFTEPATTIWGHGVASATSFSTVMGQGDAVRQYGSGLDVTGTTKLLWESGLLGTSLFISLFFIGFRMASEIARTVTVDRWVRATAAGLRASFPLLALALFYEVTSVSSPPVQFLFMFALGFVAFWHRKVVS